MVRKDGHGTLSVGGVSAFSLSSCSSVQMSTVKAKKYKTPGKHIYSKGLCVKNLKKFSHNSVLVFYSVITSLCNHMVPR